MEPPECCENDDPPEPDGTLELDEADVEFDNRGARRPFLEARHPQYRREAVRYVPEVIGPGGRTRMVPVR